jgi:two-component system sensor histidine kinase RegB
VQITAAAATLGSRWTWGLTALAVSAYAGLFSLPIAEAPDAAVHAAHDFARHLQTMWIALSMAAALTAFFVTRLTTSLARREAEIAAMRESASRRDRLSALTTLAAGAAHELATPLTTVAVAARELEHAVSTLPADVAQRVGEDVRLIRSEVTRCRDILDEMGAGSGSAAGEMPTAFSAQDLVQDVLLGAGPNAASRLRTRATGSAAHGLFFLPRRAVTRALVSLVNNALDADGAGHGVDVLVTAGPDLEIVVRDEGRGMPPDVVARAGEPFFTTKPPGRGLGLGLFLVRSLADQLGGAFALQSHEGKGTVATLRLPLQVHSHVEHA